MKDKRSYWAFPSNSETWYYATGTYYARERVLPAALTPLRSLIYNRGRRAVAALFPESCCYLIPIIITKIIIAFSITIFFVAVNVSAAWNRHPLTPRAPLRSRVCVWDRNKGRERERERDHGGHWFRKINDRARTRNAFHLAIARALPSDTWNHHAIDHSHIAKFVRVPRHARRMKIRN